MFKSIEKPFKTLEVAPMILVIFYKGKRIDSLFITRSQGQFVLQKALQNVQPPLEILVIVHYYVSLLFIG